MPRGPQEKLTIEARRLKITDLLLRGIRNRREIARILGLTYRIVEHDVTAIFAEWKATNRERAETIRHQQLAELEWQRRETVGEWERSKQDRVKTTALRKETRDGVETTATHSKENQHGDASLQNILLKIQEREGELFGLPNMKPPFEDRIDDDQPQPNEHDSGE